MNERGACVHNDVLSMFPLQTSDDSIEASFHDTRVLPFGLLQGVRKDNLLSTIQEARELEKVLRIRCLPRGFGVVGKVTLIGPPTVQDRVHRTIPVDPHVDEPVTGFLRPSVGPGILGELAVPVERHVHVQRYLSSQVSGVFTSVVGRVGFEPTITGARDQYFPEPAVAYQLS